MAPGPTRITINLTGSNKQKNYGLLALDGLTGPDTRGHPGRL